MTSAHVVDVVSAVFLPIAWLGIVEPEEALQEQISERVGRWCLTEQGLYCLGEEYWLSSEEFEDEDWLEHLLEKDWLYDPSDLLHAFEQAQEQFLPARDRAQRMAVIERELRHAITAGYLVFDPSVLRTQHVYLVQRMQPEERRAFCAFLAERGFVARS